MTISFLRGLSRSRGALLLAGLTLTLAAAGPAGAQSRRYDPADLAMLPPYCLNAHEIRDNVPGGTDPAKRQYWLTVLGQTFTHIHHYCWGLIQTNIATYKERNPSKRHALLTYSIGEFDYVIQRAPRNFILLPEILARKGDNLIRLGQGAQAVGVLDQAIALKADYWPPYAYLSDYYKQVGNTAKAREILDAGLAQSPGTKALLTRRAELDAAPAKAKAEKPRAPEEAPAKEAGGEAAAKAAAPAKN